MKKYFHTCNNLFVVLFFGFLAVFSAYDSIQAVEAIYPFNVSDLTPPFDNAPKYPFTRDASITCGQWGAKSQDYPYFGAPRDRNSRNHAGIDIYPLDGKGAKVNALKNGAILQIAPFYTRATGEITYAVLVDHGDFVVNYAELQKPGLKISEKIRQGQVIGAISGTRQLHLELYAKGTKKWLKWYGKQPSNLIDPTQLMTQLFSK